MFTLGLIVAMAYLLWLFRNDPDPAWFDADELFRKEEDK